MALRRRKSSPLHKFAFQLLASTTVLLEDVHCPYLVLCCAVTTIPIVSNETVCPLRILGVVVPTDLAVKPALKSFWKYGRNNICVASSIFCDPMRQILIIFQVSLIFFLKLICVYSILLLYTSSVHDSPYLPFNFNKMCYNYY
uniref:Uncharacterized protein n=1 Tax=Micrurus spixii TaxID=129469 RepID=A0A2D4MYF5_9SAUR